MADSIQKIASSLAQATSLLDSGLRTVDAAEQLLNMLGWDLPPGVDDIGLTAVDIKSLLDKVEVFLEARVAIDASAGDGGAEADVDVSVYADLLYAVGKVLHDLRDLAGRLPATLSGAYIAQTKIDKELLPRLSSLLVMQFFASQAPLPYQLLKFLGIFELEPHDANPAIFQVEHIRHVVRYDRIGLLFSNPNGLFADVYGWGTPTFKAYLLLSAFGHLLGAIGVQGRIRKLPRRVEERLSGVPVPAAEVDPMPQLLISIVRGLGWSPLDIGVSLYGLRATAPGGTDGGIGLFPYLKGSAELSFPLSEKLTFEVDASLDLAGGVALSVRPGQPIRMQTGVTSTGSVAVSASGSLGLTLRFGRPDQRMVLLSLGDAARLDLQQFHVTVGAGLVSSTAVDMFVEAGLKGLRLMIGGGEDADGFIQKILPPDGLAAEFDLIAGWAGSKGVFFRGSAALEVKLPVHITLGPLALEGATIGVRFQGGKIPVEASVSMSANLGPLVATVDRLGLIAEFSFPDGGGNLGPLDLALKFKPPTGVGLAVDAGIVKGGGFLSIDAEKGEYAGALELVFSGFITLKAIGIINTRMPDGSKGFSLLIIVTAEFGTGIQLGFGFTLLAVGGLLGLNRTMRLQPLVEGVRTGAVNSIMFPQNVIANITRIISDLRTIFPPEEGKFLIGPMAKLGWGTPTLVSLSLGIIIEIPGNIAILGVLRVALPADAIALIVLQVNFLGAIEFDKKRFYFFASLYESRVLFITIEGEMGVLAAFGADANFVISVGGFHPQFTPPPLPFPVPRRISVNILNESWARIRAEGYFAVTTNTAQFGARAECFFGFDALSIEGYIAFDALIQFSPLYFIVSISASYSIKVFGMGVWGIRVRFELEGPSKWRAKGTGGISFFFFDIDVDFDFSWGEKRDTSLPPIQVMPLLAAEFQRDDNWRAQLPPGSNLLVSLRQLGAAEAGFVLHPIGTLKVSQKAIPLAVTIDKVGNQKPSDAKRFTVTVASGGLSKRADATESFAPAQFQNFDDATKLSKPAYQQMTAGLELSVQGQQLASGVVIKRVVRYELITIDTNFRRFVRRFFLFAGSLFAHFLKGASVTKSELSVFRKSKLDPFAEKLSAQTETFSVVFQSNNRVFHAEAASFTSEAVAADYLSRKVAADPALHGELQVIPECEVAA